MPQNILDKSFYDIKALEDFLEVKYQVFIRFQEIKNKFFISSA